MFWLSFIGLTVQRVLQLKKNAVRVLVLGRHQRSGSASLERLYLPGLAAWFGVILLHVFNAADLLPPALTGYFFAAPVLRVIGLICIGLGMLLYIAGISALGQAWRIGIDPDQPGGLVTDGIYAYCRNPIMLCLILYGIGTWLVYPTALLAFGMLCVTGAAHVQTLREERFLLSHYGADYRRYRGRIGRYITLRRRA